MATTIAARRSSRRYPNTNGFVIVGLFVVAWTSAISISSFGYAKARAQAVAAP
jgi:hypothetical protein